MKVFLRVLTPEKETKFTAVVASHPKHHPIPLEPANAPQLLVALFRWPATLFMATPRILYQAYHLQYTKKLAVFPRPEPTAEGQKGVWNAAEEDKDKVGVGIGRQPIGGEEVVSRDMILKWAERRAVETSISLEIHFQDPREDVLLRPGAGRRLKIDTSDAAFFTHLVVSLSAQHSLVLFPEMITEVSDPDTFREFFSAEYDPTPKPDEKDYLSSLASRLRFSYFQWFLSYSLTPPTPGLYSHIPPHYLAPASLKDRLQIAHVVAMTFFASWAEERVMYLLSARFVEGGEPWKVWERALRRMYVDGTSQESETIQEGWEDLGSLRYASTP